MHLLRRRLRRLFRLVRDPHLRVGRDGLPGEREGREGGEGKGGVGFGAGGDEGGGEGEDLVEVERGLEGVGVRALFVDGGGDPGGMAGFGGEDGGGGGEVVFDGDGGGCAGVCARSCRIANVSDCIGGIKKGGTNQRPQ